jgi:hypothetical protein
MEKTLPRSHYARMDALGATGSFTGKFKGFEMNGGLEDETTFQMFKKKPTTKRLPPLNH